MAGGVTSRWQRRPRSIGTVSIAESSLGSRMIRGGSGGSARTPAGRLRTARGSGTGSGRGTGRRRGAGRRRRLGGRGRKSAVGGALGRTGSHLRLRERVGRGRGVACAEAIAGRTRCITTTLRTSGHGGGTRRSAGRPRGRAFRTRRKRVGRRLRSCAPSTACSAGRPAAPNGP